MTTAAVVLAAGGGSRFAGRTSKLLAPFRGRPLVSWAVDAALAAALDETVVVTGAVDLSAVMPADVTLLHNQAWPSGLATSLRVGLDWCERQAHRAAVVGLGDQPLVPTEAWRTVATSTGSPIVVATYSGRRRNPVKLDRSVWPLVPVTGDQGARAVIGSQPALVREVACPGDPADVDTVEDLRLWS
ncbi:MAG TPA: nucleotidyltransferase family protein [Acidimicrobiales bacterium]|nr:nucleotidyltransferase family protein [Acidimicrobiales bacterium]